MIHKSYRQGERRYEGIVDPAFPTLPTNFTDNLYIPAGAIWDELEKSSRLPVGGETAVTAGPRFSFLSPEAIFGNTNPLSVEIGTGNGAFIVHNAASDIGVNWLGFEVFHEVFEKAVKAALKADITNVRLIQFDAELFVRLLPPQSISAFFINFPDPWPKTRHKKRRLVRSWFIELLRDKLSPEGLITAITDHEDYAEDMSDNFKTVSGLTAVFPGGYTTDTGDYFRTKYFRKFAPSGDAFLFKYRKDGR